MIQANLQELQKVIAGSSLTQDVSFVGVSTDSRKINRGNLFVALSGENFDAHDFLHAVAAAGAAAVVVEHVPEGLTIPALVVPGNDASHATSAARYLEECLPNSEYWDMMVAGQTREASEKRVLEFLAKHNS